MIGVLGVLLHLYVRLHLLNAGSLRHARPDNRNGYQVEILMQLYTEPSTLSLWPPCFSTKEKRKKKSSKCCTTLAPQNRPDIMETRKKKGKRKRKKSISISRLSASSSLLSLQRCR